MRDDPRPARPVTHLRCARITAARWGVLGAVFGLVATAAQAWRDR